MIAKIQRNQIRLFKDLPADGEHSQPWDSLQLGIQFTDYPDQPTYGIALDVTDITTQVALRAAIVTEVQALVTKVEGRIVDNAGVRDYFDTWGWSDVEFETDNL